MALQGISWEEFTPFNVLQKTLPKLDMNEYPPSLAQLTLNITAEGNALSNKTELYNHDGTVIYFEGKANVENNKVTVSLKVTSDMNVEMILVRVSWSAHVKSGRSSQDIGSKERFFVAINRGPPVLGDETMEISVEDLQQFKDQTGNVEFEWEAKLISFKPLPLGDDTSATDKLVVSAYQMHDILENSVVEHEDLV